MKYWKTAESKKYFKYLILKQDAFIYCETSKDITLKEAVEQNKLFKVNTIKLIDLDAVLCDDSSNTLTLDYLQRGKSDFDIDVEPLVYKEIKNYLLDNFKGTDVQDYSFFKQSSWNIAGLIVSILVARYQYLQALDIQINGVKELKIRRGIFDELSFQISNFLTPTGCIIVGGAFISFFGYLILKAVLKPKQGKLFKLGGKSRILIE